MKILYHHRTASRDGQSTHIDEMIRGLRAEGHLVVESSPQVKGDNAGGGSPGWVGRLKALLPRHVYELAELAYSWIAYRRLADAIKKDRPDGIYERYNLYMLAGIWAKKRFGLPLILEVNAPMAVERRQYGGLSWPRLADWAELYVWKRADVILPVTHVLADYMVTKGIDAARIQVIPNGINEDHYSNLPSATQAKDKLGLVGRLVIGFTGFVREWDRLDRIMTWVAKRAAQHNVHLLVIGDGPARAEIEARAAQLGVSDRLSFTGAVQREQVPALSMAFDIALQTALVPYASPLCLFEYLALGKAIVAPDQPNHHEILCASVNALLYDPYDASGIEKALDALCEDDVLRDRIATAARGVIVSKQLTWRQHARKVVGLFEHTAMVPSMENSSANQSSSGKQILIKSLTSIASKVTGRGLSVLTFHDVLKTGEQVGKDEINIDQFIDRIIWLKQQVTIVPLEEGLATLRSGRSKGHKVVITFDDGYTSNVTIVLPVLKKLGIHATFFVLPGLLGKSIWPEDVRNAIRRTTVDVLDLADLGFGNIHILTCQDRRGCAETLLDSLKRLPDSQRREYVDEILLRSGVSPLDNLLVNESQIRELANAGMEVGSHSMSHPILSRTSRDVATWEIFQSRRVIAELTGRPARYLAYPNGRPGIDYTKRDMALVQAAGYEAAFSTGWGSISKGACEFELPRFTPWDNTRGRFQARMMLNLLRSSKSSFSVKSSSPK